MKINNHLFTWGQPTWLLIFFLLLGTGTVASAQVASDTLWVVETKEGNIYTGTLEDLGAEGVRISTQVGVLTIPRDMIVSVKRAGDAILKDGVYWEENPHSSRHFWVASGYGLRQGEGYYQNVWMLFNQVSVGFTDNVTVGVGVVPLFLFGLTEYTPVWITPKVSFPYRNGKGAFGAGTIFFGVLGLENSGNGILYGVNTFGSRERQFTFGLGYGYNSENGFASLPTVSMSGMIRTGRKWVFVTENYFISSGDFTLVLLSAGARYIGKRLAIDFGGIAPLSSELEQLIVVPWLGIAVPFGKKKGV